MNWNPVYNLVKKIPRGRVMTYGQIAKALRLPGGARTAGRAMAASPNGQGVPWHRVVGAGGRLLIREPHSSLQRKLLESEGVSLAEKRILQFRNHQWSPGKTRHDKSPAKKKRSPDRHRQVGGFL
jgi:methylated-DNA-protein-cysteine methyltransferase-like protein